MNFGFYKSFRNRGFSQDFSLPFPTPIPTFKFCYNNLIIQFGVVDQKLCNFLGIEPCPHNKKELSNMVQSDWKLCAYIHFGNSFLFITLIYFV